MSAVGLGTVPAWLRPFQVLNNGEQFRANLAKALADEPNRLIIDEFSSVVDRQIACIGASAFAKAWKRTKGKQAILLTCHYDVLNWLEPDWVYNTDTGEFTVNHRRSLWQRPPIAFDIYQTNWRFWELFEPHHYLKMPKMIASTNYVAVVNGELVAHLAVSTTPGLIEARACRLVVMPEWQGAGIGMRFLNAICQMWLEGNNRYNKPLRTIFHTSHPNLAQALRRDKKWTQISAKLHGDNKMRSFQTLSKASGKSAGSGYGGHFRAVQGFRYLGENFNDE
ncbi:GNAT family N-acetyltransferase [Moraxella bovis]|uniref:GNAT family N-acetyltransferase n=1 Tax=Moraxella bovis TaxID=476 RepID=UPI00222781EB|nr:GNAT family N-acetyltransferase [Moraxella bovis]UZA40750.1 GNAT family N-acetyltransferase [Moraxella bovis]